jgi:hypothetical protein
MTISTFYPPDSDNDGSMKAYEGNSQTWDFMRDHAGLWSTDNEEENSQLTAFIGWAVNGSSNAAWDRMHRTIMIFDTSSIPDGDEMHEATLSIWLFEPSGWDAGAYNAGSWSTAQKSIVLTQGTTASDTAVAAGDYDAIKGATKWSSGFDMTFDTNANPSASGGWSDNSYSELDLNATGLSNVSKTGVTKIAVQSEADVDDDPPSITGGTNRQVLAIFEAIDSDDSSSKGPKLVVRHGVDFIPRVIMF